MRLIPPKDLSPLAQAEWRRIVQLLSKSGVLDKHDTSALTIYATSYANYIESSRAVQEQGTVILNAQGTPIKNPHFQIMKESWDRLKTLLIDFGLTPKSRAKLLTPEPTDLGDDFSDLSGKGGI